MVILVLEYSDLTSLFLKKKQVKKEDQLTEDCMIFNFVRMSAPFSICVFAHFCFRWGSTISLPEKKATAGLGVLKKKKQCGNSWYITLQRLTGKEACAKALDSEPVLCRLNWRDVKNQVNNAITTHRRKQI